MSVFELHVISMNGVGGSKRVLANLAVLTIWPCLPPRASLNTVVQRCRLLSEAGIVLVESVLVSCFLRLVNIRGKGCTETIAVYVAL